VLHAAGFVRCGRIGHGGGVLPWPSLKRGKGGEDKAEPWWRTAHTTNGHKWLKEESADESDVAFGKHLGEDRDIVGYSISIHGTPVRLDERGSWLLSGRDSIRPRLAHTAFGLLHILGAGMWSYFHLYQGSR
jgi:hypothetical protein